MSANGPYVAVAALCEHVLDEKVGRLSCIRFFEKYNIIVPPESPEQNPKTPLYMAALLAFKSGDFTGTKVVKVTLRYPSDAPSKEILAPYAAVFAGGETGVNMIINITLHVDTEGLYMFDVLLNEECVTRIPLRVVFSRTPPPNAQPAN